LNDLIAGIIPGFVIAAILIAVMSIVAPRQLIGMEVGIHQSVIKSAVVQDQASPLPFSSPSPSPSPTSLPGG
jgi:hypothetical protein